LEGKDVMRKEFEKLTPSEVKVFELAVKGMTNKEIAAILNISIHTVKSQIHSILQKTEMRDRKQLCFEFSEYFRQNK
jgi:RNA polymerase sigma factor (sigma-70 family)